MKEHEKLTEKQIKELKEKEREIKKINDALYLFTINKIRSVYDKAESWEYEEIQKYNRVNKAIKDIQKKEKESRNKINKIIGAFLVSQMLKRYKGMAKATDLTDKGFTKSDAIEKIKKPWSGLHFTRRLWRNKESSQDAIEGIIIGSATNETGITKAIEGIKKEFKKINSDDKRLISSEWAHGNYEADSTLYKDNNKTYLEYVATFDNTCDDCASLHGNVYELGTEPKLPQHPNCVCYYVIATV